MERPTFSQNLTNERAAVPYPHVEILDRHESVALVIRTLNGSGDLPIVFNNNGMRVQIAKIQLSALSLHTLKRVSKILWNASPDESCELSSTDDIMQALSKLYAR